MRDVLSAIRWLRKNPWFALAVTAILGLGIGATTAVFSIVDAVLIRPLPYQSSSTLVKIEETGRERVISYSPVNDYLYWRDRNDLFEKTAPYRRDVLTLTNIGAPDQVFTVRTSAKLFSMLGVPARLGRPLIDADDALNAPNVALLSDRLWRRVFRSDPSVIGRSITVSDELYTIVGVMPPEFEFPLANTEMWIPLRLDPESSVGLQVVGQTRSGLRLSQVQGAMEIVARQLERRDPKENAGLRIRVSPWLETPDQKYRLSLVLILAAVSLVLLIGCANVGSLLLSRAVQRQKEMAIRASLGAGFWRVVRQLLAESLMLAMLASATGIAVAHYLLQFLLRQLAVLPIVIPHVQRVALNGRVLLFNLGLCLLLACVCSVAPAVFASRTDVQSVLRSGQATGTKSSTRLFSILIASEAAFACLLLVGSGLLVHSLIRLQKADTGFRTEHVLTMRVPLGTQTQPKPGGQYASKSSQIEFYQRVLERLEKVPGVSAVAVVNNLPLSGSTTTTIYRGTDGTVKGVLTRTVSPQYFAVMGTPLIKGRVFSEADQADSPEVAIINEYWARELFPDRDPIGQLLPSEGGGQAGRVVGVVKNSWQSGWDQPTKAEKYIPYRQFIFGAFLATIVVRTSGEPLALANTLRKEIWAVDPSEPVLRIETMDDVIANSIWQPRFSAWVFSVLGGLALLLTAAGIYGVVAYTTALRAKEVGIRVALGASPQRIIAVVLRGTIMPLSAGLAASLVAALVLARLLTSILYEISGADPIPYLAAAALLLAIGALASARPAWKAAAADPLTALRTE
jgi:putative ABC transport system permease protein